MISRTKEKLAEAFKNVVGRKTFAKTTIVDITTECGMTRENFYYHFHDKYEILKWVCQKELVPCIPETINKKTVEEAIIRLVGVINKDYKFYRTIVKDLGEEQVRQAALPYVRKLTEKLVGETIDESIWKMRREKESFAAEFFSDAFIAYFTTYLLNHEKMDQQIMVMNVRFLFTQFF